MGNIDNTMEKASFISVKEVVHITVWLYRSSQTGEPFRIYASELITSVLQKRNKRFYHRSMQMIVDIFSNFNNETGGKYNIFVNDKNYKTWWHSDFEQGELESIQIKVLRK